MKKYKVKKSDLKGQISNFPLAIVQRMVDYQSEPCVEAFQLKEDASPEDGGFSWGDTKEGKEYWDLVIRHQKFDLDNQDLFTPYFISYVYNKEGEFNFGSTNIKVNGVFLLSKVMKALALKFKCPNLTILDYHQIKPSEYEK
jgi:hypothetical protein